jgi:hypothetical protein
VALPLPNFNYRKELYGSGTWIRVGARYQEAKQLGLMGWRYHPMAGGIILEDGVAALSFGCPGIKHRFR